MRRDDLSRLLASIGLLLLTAASVSGGGHASIKSKYGQLVTSSTLRWRSVTRREMMGPDKKPKDAVESGSGNLNEVVCRAEHHGTLILGHTVKDGSCAVAFVNKVHKKHRFEVLLNVKNAAKLEWMPYAKFIAVPEGAVSAVDGPDGQFFIGRYNDRNANSLLPGSIDVQSSSFSFGPMTIFDESGHVKEVSTGEVMVEVEPERYEVEILQKPSANTKPKVTRQDTVLAKSSLFRFDEGRDREARLQKVLSYDYDKSDYYGQVPGMIRALPTSIREFDGRVHSIRWGLPEKSHQKETLMVGHSLRHQSAVDVSIVGIRITEEEPYSAVLTSVFPDGSKRQRKINGVLQRKYLNNIRPEYSRVYRIKDTVHVSATPIVEEEEEREDDQFHKKSHTETPKETNKRDRMFSDQKTNVSFKTSEKRSNNDNGEDDMSSSAVTAQNSSSNIKITSGFMCFILALRICLSW